MIFGNVFDKSHAACRLAFNRLWLSVHYSANASRTSETMDFGRLEDRVLYSVSPGAEIMAVADAPDGIEADATNDVLDSFFDLGLDEQDTDTWADGLDEVATQMPGNQDVRRELVIVDPGAQAYQQLVDDLLNNASDGRQMDVYVLDATSDGVEQISQVLAQYDDLNAVHVISHGTNGAVKLGDTWLGSTNVSGYAGQIAGWRGALSEQADVLFYGCDLASDANGRILAESIGALSGADVAASDDLTGHADLGGDWNLEFSSGTIETTLAVSPEAQDAWFGLLAAGVTHTNDEVLVNQSQIIEQSPDVAMDDDGNFVVVWQAGDQSGDDWDIYARLYDAQGNPLGGQWLVNQTTDQNQYDAAVAMDETGNFVITWVSDHGVDLDVYARVFDSGGTALTNETLVGADDPTGNQANPDVAIDGNGNFTVVWQGNGPGDADGIFVQSYGLDGVALGGASKINSQTSGVQEDPAIAVNPLGSSEVAFVDRGVGAGHEMPQIGIGDDGNYVVAWHEYDSGAGRWSVLHRRYDDSGTPLGAGAMPVDMASMSDQVEASLAVNSEGDYTITWTAAGQDGDGAGVFGQSFLADGTPMGNAFLINTTSLGDQHHSSVATNDAGNLVVAWDGNGPGDSDGVFVRVHEAASSPSFSTLWLSTTNDVAPVSGLPGLDTWGDDDVLQLNGFGQISTADATFAFRLSDFYPSNDTNIDAIHYVSQDVLTGHTQTVNLRAGDVLLSTSGATTLNGSNSLSVGRDDVFVFRPDNPNDYSSGSFFMVLEGVSTANRNVTGLTLVEQDTTVGSTRLTAGSILYSQVGATSNDIWLFEPGKDGFDYTPSTKTLLIDGSDMDMGSGSAAGAGIAGLELIETDTVLGGAALQSGQLLVTLSDVDTAIGNDASISASGHDVIILDVSSTGLRSTQANASIFLDGAELGLNTPAESIDGLAIAQVPSPFNTSPHTGDDRFTVDEGDVLNVSQQSVLDNDSDPNQDPLIAVLQHGPEHATEFHLNPDGTFLYKHDGSETTSDSFVYLASDGRGGTTTATVQITVDPVNDAPAAENDRYVMRSKGPLIVKDGVLANDTDAEGDKLTAKLIDEAQNGELKFHEDGTFTYTPNPGFFGIELFRYTTNDGQDESDMALVRIDVVRPIFNPHNPVLDPELPSTGDTKPDDDLPSSEDPDVEDEDPTSGNDELPERSNPMIGQAAIAKTDMSTSKPYRDEAPQSEPAPANAPRLTEFSVVSEREDVTVSASRASSMRTATRTWEVSRPDMGFAASLAALVEAPAATTLDGSFLAGLNETTDVALSELDFGNLTVGAVGMMTVGLSVGYAFASARFGNLLASSLLATMPVWRVRNPLPVLAYLDQFEASNGNGDEDDGDSLESIVDRAGKRGP